MSDETTNTPTIKNSTAMTFSYTPSTSNVASSYYIPWTSPAYTTGYMYAQLTEQQLGDLEERFRKVMRSELKFLLTQVLAGLEDESDEEDEEA